jgi:oligoribonuclease
MEKKIEKIFWMDLEMTGLDHTKDHILELAACITDTHLTILDKMQSVIFQPPSFLENMAPIVRKMHTQSGLLEKIPSGQSLEKAEEEVLTLIQKHFSSEEKICLAGNSVHNDKRFIDQLMPKLSARLHYRIIDVSSFKEIFQKKYQKTYQKANAHEALKDVYASIDELKFYLSFIPL